MDSDIVELDVPGSYNCNPETFDEFYENISPPTKEEVDTSKLLTDPPPVPLDGPGARSDKALTEESKYWEILKSKLLNNDTRAVLGIGKSLDATSLKQSTKQQLEDQAALKDGVNLLGKLVAEQAALKETIDRQRREALAAQKTFSDWQSFVNKPSLRNMQIAEQRFSQALGALDTVMPYSQSARGDLAIEALKRNDARITDLAAGLEGVSDALAAGVDGFGALLQSVTGAAGNEEGARKIRELRSNISNYYEEFTKGTKDILGPVGNTINTWTDFKNRMENGMTYDQFLNGMAGLERQFGKDIPGVAQLSRFTQSLQKGLDELQKIDREIAEVLNTVSALIDAISIIVLSICRLIPALIGLVEFFKRLGPLMIQLALLTLYQALVPSNINLKMPQINISTAASWRGLTTALAGLGNTLKACGEPLKQLAKGAENISNLAAGGADFASNITEGIGKGLGDVITSVTAELAKLVTSMTGIKVNPDFSIDIPIDPNPLAALRGSVASMVDTASPRPTLTPDIMGLLGTLFGAVNSIGFNLEKLGAKFGPGASNVDKLDLLKRLDGPTPNAKKQLVGADTFKDFKNKKRVIQESLKIAQTSAETTKIFVDAAREIEKLGYDASPEVSKEALEKIVEATQILNVIQNSVLDEELNSENMSLVAKDFYRCKQEKEQQNHSEEQNHPSPNDKTDITKITESFTQDLADIVSASPGLPNSFLDISEEIRKTGKGSITDPGTPSYLRWSKSGNYGKGFILTHKGLYYEALENIIASEANESPAVDIVRWKRVDNPRVYTPSEFLNSLPLTAFSIGYYTEEQRNFIRNFTETHENPTDTNLLMLKFFPMFLVLQTKESQTALTDFIEFTQRIQNIINGTAGDKVEVADYVKVAKLSLVNDKWGFLGRGFVALSIDNNSLVPASLTAVNPEAVQEKIKTKNLDAYEVLNSFLSHKPRDVRPFINWTQSAGTLNNEAPFPNLNSFSNSVEKSRVLSAALDSEAFTIKSNNLVKLVSFGNLIINIRKQADFMGGPLGFEYFTLIAVHSVINRIRFNLKAEKPDYKIIKHLTDSAKFLAENITHKKEIIQLIDSLAVLGE
jgi:hypothetical protein